VRGGTRRIADVRKMGHEGGATRRAGSGARGYRGLGREEIAAILQSQKFALDPWGCGFAFKNDVAARDVGLDASKASVTTHGDKVRHGELSRSTNVNGAQKSYVLCHVTTMDLPRARLHPNAISSAG
jgi:hypothetical protein